MNFINVEYFLFFIPVLAIYWLLPRRPQNVFLFAVSCLFYASWNPIMLSLLLFTAGVDYLVALRIDAERSPRARKFLLTLSLISNLGVLGYFKYAGFFALSLAVLLERFGVQASWTTLHVLLPVGISFYTFQSMSYTIDVYLGKLKPSRSFLEFGAFVSCFPQLVAGPIVRAKDFLPQIQRERKWDWDKAAHGSLLFLRGFIKKALIADTLAMDVVDGIFRDPGSYSGAALAAGAFCYAIQIYCDFSGYSDMARGSAAWLGFDLPVNFRYPYLAASLQEFWRRWHISLSTWFRDYLFIPLGGSKGGIGRTDFNLMLTFVISGLWHGANWTFVCWGAIHGLFLVAEKRLPQASRERLGGLAARWMITQVVVMVGWVLFRSESFSQASLYLGRILTLAPGKAAPIGGGNLLAILLFFGDCAIGLHAGAALKAWLRAPRFARGLAYACLIALLFLMVPRSVLAFIYFQF
jgi:alginate O-acetyltransferase complex protein AlgI